MTRYDKHNQYVWFFFSDSLRACAGGRMLEKDDRNITIKIDKATEGYFRISNILSWPKRYARKGSYSIGDRINSASNSFIIS